MTQEQKKSRQKKASLLEVKQLDPITYLVQSQSDPSFYYKVTLNGHQICHCADYRIHADPETGWTCKHIAAAMDLRSQVERVEAIEVQAPIQDAPSKPAIGFLAPQVPGVPMSEFAQRALDSYRAGTWKGQGTVAEVLPEEKEEVPAEMDQPQDPYSSPEQREAYRAETEALRAEASEIRESNRILLLRLEAANVEAACQQLREQSEILRQLDKERLAEAEEEAPKTLASIHELLSRPFPIAQVEVKPGSLNQEKTRALALAYVDMRAYQERLDEVAGPECWSVEYRPLGERAVICRLTILGVTREDVGEADPRESNWATCMIAQAFKRACASFGLGRYLYQLPKVWVEYDPQRKALKDPEGTIQQLYRGIKVNKAA